MIVLPWFSSELNPNSRLHWSQKIAPRQKQTSDAYWLAKEAPKPEQKEEYALKITFYPPDRRSRDIDNCLAAIKGALDGIARAWGINDKQFKPIMVDLGVVFKYGKITVEY